MLAFSENRLPRGHSSDPFYLLLIPRAPILMSALPPKADMCGATSDVRFGPKADIARLLNSSHAEGQSGFAVTVVVETLRGLSVPSAPYR